MARKPEREVLQGRVVAVEELMALNGKRVISRLNIKNKFFTVRLMRHCNSHRKCSGPDWMGLSATF